MTTEDEFQAMLDANPGDWQTRAIFADWLDERDDPRGPGYRELARRRKRPVLFNTFRRGFMYVWVAGGAQLAPTDFGWDDSDFRPEKMRGANPRASSDFFALPGRWVRRFANTNQLDDWHSLYWIHFHTRRGAEDQAALAFKV